MGKSARWDEYMIVVRNLSDSSITVEDIRLIDPRGLYIKNGVNPQQLEELSEVMLKEYKDAGIAVAIGAAPTVIAGTAMAAGSIGAAAGALALAPVAAVAAPVYYLGKKYADQKDREAIEKEFIRRNLGTFILAGNATIKGSVFFLIIPNPKALVIDYRIGSSMEVIEVSLEKIRGLHVVDKGNK